MNQTNGLKFIWEPSRPRPQDALIEGLLARCQHLEVQRIVVGKVCRKSVPYITAFTKECSNTSCFTIKIAICCNVCPAGYKIFMCCIHYIASIGEIMVCGQLNPNVRLERVLPQKNLNNSVVCDILHEDCHLLGFWAQGSQNGLTRSWSQQFF